VAEPDGFGEARWSFRLAVGLAEECPSRVGARAFPRRLFRVAAREKDGDLGSELADSLEHLAARHFGHDEIEDHDVDGGNRAQDLERLGGAPCRQGDVPELGQHSRDGFQHRRFVVDGEDPQWGSRRLRRRLGSRRRRTRRRREAQNERRADTFVAFHLDRPPVLVSGPIYRGEAQARSLADLLRREVRLEDLVDEPGRNSGAGIGDVEAQPSVLSRRFDPQGASSQRRRARLSAD
jgi:hypothetical protein